MSITERRQSRRFRGLSYFLSGVILAGRAMMACATPGEVLLFMTGEFLVRPRIPGDTSQKDQRRKGAPQCLLFLALSRFELR